MQKIKTDWGYVIPFGDAEGYGASILVVKPGREIKPHYHKKTLEWEVILEGEGLANGKRVKVNDLKVWKLNQIHGYKNNSKKHLKILCVTKPPYDPKDDILA